MKLKRDIQKYNYNENTHASYLLNEYAINLLYKTVGSWTGSLGGAGEVENCTNNKGKERYDKEKEQDKWKDSETVWQKYKQENKTNIGKDNGQSKSKKNWKERKRIKNRKWSR